MKDMYVCLKNPAMFFSQGLNTLECSVLLTFELIFCEHVALLFDLAKTCEFISLSILPEMLSFVIIYIRFFLS